MQKCETKTTKKLTSCCKRKRTSASIVPAILTTPASSTRSGANSIHKDVTTLWKDVCRNNFVHVAIVTHSTRTMLKEERRIAGFSRPWGVFQLESRRCNDIEDADGEIWTWRENGRAGGRRRCNGDGWRCHTVVDWFLRKSGLNGM